MAEVSASDRSTVRLRATGRCEYCGLLERLGFFEHQIDHIIAVKHGGTSELSNLALSCTLCNRHKGSDIASIDPESGMTVELYHPRKQVWNQHFAFSSWQILGRTPQGMATERLLQFNRVDRIIERSGK